MKYTIRTREQKEEAIEHLNHINHIIDECESNDIPSEHLYVEKYLCEAALQEYYSLCEPACGNTEDRIDEDQDDPAFIPVEKAAVMNEDYRKDDRSNKEVKGDAPFLKEDTVPGKNEEHLVDHFGYCSACIHNPRKV